MDYGKISVTIKSLSKVAKYSMTTSIVDINLSQTGLDSLNLLFTSARFLVFGNFESSEFKYCSEPEEIWF